MSGGSSRHTQIAATTWVCSPHGTRVVQKDEPKGSCPEADRAYCIWEKVPDCPAARDEVIDNSQEKALRDAETVLAALDLGLQAWRTTPSRTRFVDAVAALGWLRESAVELADLREAISRLAQLQPDPLGFWDDLNDDLAAVRAERGETNA